MINPTHAINPTHGAEQTIFPVIIKREAQSEDCGVIIVPWRQRVPHSRPVTIRWILAGNNLEWDHTGGGIVMKGSPEWPCDPPGRNDPFYELAAPVGCPIRRLIYQYSAYLLVDGEPCEIDPEVEYDDE